MERMGVSNGVVVNEEPSRLAAVFPEFFDGIVVDAPCSGEGMFRKDEEAVEQWSEEHVKMCAARQEQILAQAARMIKPGGRIVYSTCTFAPEENEGTVLNFLKCHEDFYLEQTEGCEKFSHGKPEWAGFGDGEEKSHEEEAAIYHLERTFRLLPHCLEGEGHFIAVIRRREGIERKEAKRTYPAYLDRRRNRDVFSLLEAFLKESLADGSSYLNRAEYVMFGDQLYLLPGEMPDLKGLKVLRPGLHMGTVKKNRFEPSHALALSLLPEEAKRVYRMEADGEETAAYLRGEALSCRMESWPGNEKGWVLMCAEDWSLGWSKLSGGVLRIIIPKASDGCRRLRTLRNKGSHVIRKRCEKGHGFFGKRMDKVKPEGVERLPVYKAVIRMVEKISGKRVADMGHMNPYLVGSSRVQSQADIGKIIFAVVGKLCKMGTGIFAVFKVCLAHDGRAGNPCDGDCDGPFGGKVSADNCPVFPADLPLYHLIGKDTGA